MTSLVTGVAGLRLAADAVLDLWQRDDGRLGRRPRRGARGAAREHRGRRRLVRATSRRASPAAATVPEPLAPDEPADGRLVDAVRRDLRGEDGEGSATAVRMIWTGDHLDAARRLQAALVGPAVARGLALTERRRRTNTSVQY